MINENSTKLHDKPGYTWDDDVKDHNRTYDYRQVLLVVLDKSIPLNICTMHLKLLYSIEV